MESLGAVSIEVAERLERAGLKSLKALAATPPAFIAEVAEIPFDRAYEICRRAWLSGGSTFTTALELLERRRSASSLTTGCRALDELLGGGVEAKAITEVCGEYGSGKTQLCHQLCVTVQLPPSRGGLSASALYIDTEGTFRPERLIAIAERFNLPHQQVLGNVMYARAYSSDHQAFLVDEACKVIEERKVGVVVVDSLVGHFRGELCGRELLAERQQRLNRHVHQLLRVAEVFNVAVVVTNQVLSVPEPSSPSSFSSVNLSLNWEPLPTLCFGHMAKVVRFLRMRTSLILIVYGAFLYFCSHSSRAASRALSSMVRRSHTSILSWFRSLSSLFVDRSLRGKVKLLLIDDTRVEVGGREQVLFVAFEPRLRRIVYMRLFEAANILTALTFMKKLRPSTGLGWRF
jgi:DNA repair protein RadA